LSYPRSRNWEARIPYPGKHYSEFTEYTPHGLNAGGVGHVQAQLELGTGSSAYPFPETASTAPRHGLCGDARGYFDSGDAERYLHSGNVLHTFAAGEPITLEWIVTAHHNGHIEVSICDLGDPSSENGRPSQECLDKHKLERVADPGAPVESPIDPNFPTRYYLDPKCAASDSRPAYAGTVDGSFDYVAVTDGLGERGHKMRAKSGPGRSVVRALCAPMDICHCELLSPVRLPRRGLAHQLL